MLRKRQRVACRLRGAAGDAWCSDVVRKARKEFGVTDDPREAGYIMPDGAMLDFSGKHAGGEPGTRERDHREIGIVTGQGGTEGMLEFMADCCAIRFHLDRRRDQALIEAHAPCRPTAGQRRTLRDIEPFTSGFGVDVTDDIGLVAYTTNASADEAIALLTRATRKQGSIRGARRRRGA